MSSPRWPLLLPLARAARAHGVPVTVLNGNRKQDGMINEIDRLIAMALQTYEDSICSGCRLPHSKTRGDCNVGRIEWKDDQICHGCESKDSLLADKNRVTFPGQMLYPVDTHADR